MIFDSHAHYNDNAFDEDREVLLTSLKDYHIGTVVNVSSDLASIIATRELAERYDFIYGAVGVHPTETGELTEESFAWLKEQAQQKKW